MVPVPLVVGGVGFVVSLVLFIVPLILYLNAVKKEKKDPNAPHRSTYKHLMIALIAVGSLGIIVSGLALIFGTESFMEHRKLSRNLNSGVDDAFKQMKRFT